MPLFFWFLTIWLIYGHFLISILKISVVKNISAAKVWILIAPFAFLYIVWFIMKHFEIYLDFSDDFNTTDSLDWLTISHKVCKLMTLMLKRSNYIIVQQNITNWCNLMKIIFSFANRAIKPLKKTNLLYTLYPTF